MYGACVSSSTSAGTPSLSEGGLGDVWRKRLVPDQSRHSFPRRRRGKVGMGASSCHYAADRNPTLTPCALFTGEGMHGRDICTPDRREQSFRIGTFGAMSRGLLPVLPRCYPRAMAESTTLKLPEDLKRRVVRAATEVGQSPHAFMVEAIERQTQLAERRREFVGAALTAEEEVAQYGLVHDGDEVLAYLQARFTDAKATRPRKRKL